MFLFSGRTMIIWQKSKNPPSVTFCSKRPVLATSLDLVSMYSHGSGLWLGWEFWFLVPILGKPIGSGIPIPFQTLDIPVGFFSILLLNSYPIGIPICKTQNSGILFTQELIAFHFEAILYWFLSMYNNLIRIDQGQRQKTLPISFPTKSYIYLLYLDSL